VQPAEPAHSSVRIISLSIATVIIFLTVLSIPLAAGQEMGLSTGALSSWIMMIYGVPSALGIILTYRYQQPIPLTGTIIAIIFVASIGNQLTYSEIIGGFVVAGFAVTLLASLGLTRYLTHIIPPPIVWAVLAGVVLPFVVQIFGSLGREPVLVGTTLIAYFLSRWWMGSNPAVILPALAVGIAAAQLTGELGTVAIGGGLATPTITVPTFSVHSIATIVPVVVVLMTVQANIPTTLILRDYDYDPPERTVNIISGISTMAGSLFGPMAASLSLPLASLIAGPDAGEHSTRHHTIYFAYVAAMLVALFAGAAAVLSQIIPFTLLMGLAGLAMLGVLTSALQHMVSGNLLLGPVFAFAVAVSDMSLFGFGSIFWALLIGVGVSMLLEGKQLHDLRISEAEVSAPAPAMRVKPGS
jgi:benzoate membrane transport protein